jgi:hypothetical protein
MMRVCDGVRGMQVRRKKDGVGICEGEEREEEGGSMGG